MFTEGCHVYSRCHLPYPLQLGVAPFYASSFLTSLKCNEYRLWFELVSYSSLTLFKLVKYYKSTSLFTVHSINEYTPSE